MANVVGRNTQIILEEIDRQLDNFIDRVYELAIQNLVDDNKIDTGMLAQTAIINRNPLNKEIVFPVNYASNVEFGRQAGERMPPPSALYKWVERKLGIKKEAEIKRVSFAIARAISERGIEPAFYLDRARIQAEAEFGL